MRFFIPAVFLVATAHAHGGLDHASKKPAVSADANWMTKHMAEEHHLDVWDAASFFSLHDFDADGTWQPREMLGTYGLFDASNKDVPDSRRAEIVRELMALLDRDGDGTVTRDEFVGVLDGEATLPDMGTGPGHHGDEEHEYEIHHWEMYHDDETTLEDLTHPEDVEHFRKHEEMDREQERLEALGQRNLIEENIPNMFLREL